VDVTVFFFFFFLPVQIFFFYFSSLMTSSSCESVVVIGGGPVGTAASILLSRRGHSVTVIESREDTRLAGNIYQGRSINLALSERGLDTLKAIGIAEQVVKEVMSENE
jgi:kynurenine 3-monooxygenase